MNDELNPYAAPAAPSANLKGRQAYPELSLAELKNYNTWSRSIRALNVLLAIVVVSVVCVSITGLKMRSAFVETESLLLAVVLNGGLLITLIGCMLRTYWGRFLGLLLYSLTASVAIASFNPMGILIPALAIYTLLRGKKLFGPGRYEYKVIREELKYRKVNGVG